MKNLIEIRGKLYNLDMLVDVEPIGPQGTGGYRLNFCNGSWTKFEVPELAPGPFRVTSPEYKRYHLCVATATAIREYLFSRTIQVVPGPYRRDDD